MPINHQKPNSAFPSCPPQLYWARTLFSREFGPFFRIGSQIQSAIVPSRAVRGRHHPPSPDERAAAEDDDGLRGRLRRQANLPRNLALLCVDPSHQASVVQCGAATHLWNVFRFRRQFIHIPLIMGFFPSYHIEVPYSKMLGLRLQLLVGALMPKTLDT